MGNLGYPVFSGSATPVPDHGAGYTAGNQLQQVTVDVDISKSFADTGRIYVGMEMMQVKKPMLHPGVEGIISAADFIELSEGAQIIFV